VFATAAATPSAAESPITTATDASPAHASAASAAPSAVETTCIASRNRRRSSWSAARPVHGTSTSVGRK
jgi:hypothetical protein